MRYIDADKLKSVKSIQSADFNSIETIREWVDAQPTADVRENVRGEWIETNKTDEWYWHLSKCSVCGHEMLLNEDNFCPNCGSDMRSKSC